MKDLSRDELVTALDQLIKDMARNPRRNTEFDVRIYYVATKHAEPPKDADWEQMALAAPVMAYTSSIENALLLLPHGWWWTVSHLETRVIPTTPAHGAPVHDSTDYKFNGRPVAYTCMTHGDRRALAPSLCIAFLRAKLGLILKEKARSEGRMYRVDTGSGVMIADRTGKLLEMPAGSWLTDDGKLIARLGAFPQYDFQEPEE